MKCALEVLLPKVVLITGIPFQMSRFFFKKINYFFTAILGSQKIEESTEISRPQPS